MFLVVVGAGLWLFSSFGAWLFVKYHRGIADAKYADLVLPSRWTRYRICEGNHFIAQAEYLFGKGEPATALFHLRAGIARSPANARGRILLARLYQSNRRPDLAREVLLDGLLHLSANPEYLQTTLSFLLESQEDARIQEIAARYLDPPATTDAPCRPIAALFAATAAFHRGDYDRAEDLISQHRLRDSLDGAILLARIEWERHYPDLALLLLRDHLTRHPEHDAARALLAGYYRSLGRATDWESTVIERLANDPLAAAPRIENLRLHDHRDGRPHLERDVALYLEQFRHDPAALLLLADFAASTGRPALARRVQDLFSQLPENSGAPALLVAESLIAAREYQPALDLIDEYARQYPEWTGQFSAIYDGLQAVALCGLGRKDEARLHLDHLLAQKNLRAENLLAVSDRLSALGADDLSLTTLNRAVEADPLNQAALTGLIRLELETDALAGLPDHLHRFMRTRKPSRELLVQAYATLGSDRYLYHPRQRELLASLHTMLVSRQR